MTARQAAGIRPVGAWMTGGLLALTLAGCAAEQSGPAPAAAPSTQTSSAAPQAPTTAPDTTSATAPDTATAAAAPAVQAPPPDPGGPPAPPLPGNAVTTRAEFERRVVGRPFVDLNETVQILLNPDGTLTGNRLDGAALSGPWYFDEAGYFCRDVTVGSRNLGWDCQVVITEGNDLTLHRERGLGQQVRYRFL